MIVKPLVLNNWVSGPSGSKATYDWAYKGRYTYVYIYIYSYIHTHMHIHIHTHIYIYIYIYTLYVYRTTDDLGKSPA